VSRQTALLEALSTRAGAEAVYRAPDALAAQAFRYFAQAVGDLNPLWLDPEAARQAGFGGVVAPPTLVVETNAYSTKPPGPDGYIGHDWDLPTPEGWRLVRGGNRYELSCPVGEGVVLETRWRLVGHEARTSRSGAPMVIVTGEEAVLDAVSGRQLAKNVDRLVWLGPTEAEGVDGGGTKRPAGATSEPPGALRAALREGETPRAWEIPERGWPEPEPGAELAPLVRRIDLVDMVAYAGATWDWHRLHYDQAWVAGIGLERPVVDGQVLGALACEACLDWAGPRWWPEKVDLRLISPVLAGEVVAVSGRVQGTSGRGPTVVLEVWAGDGSEPDGPSWRAVATVSLVLEGLER